MAIAITELGDIAHKFDVSDEEAARIAANVDSEQGFVVVWQETDWWIDGKDHINKLHGHDAVNLKEANTDIVLNKYTDPTQEHKNNITMDEAKEILNSDPSLVYCDIALPISGNQQ